MHAGNPSEPLQSFARFVARHMGLRFPRARLAELAQKMSNMGREAGFEELDQYLLQLMAAPLSRERMKDLSAALTIGETYFLRDPKSFRVLEDTVLPELIAARRGAGKSIRIWSAGCSTGEEPYSIAIILSRLLGDLPDWSVTLLGTDINPAALERAVLGVYSPWSFRNAPGWLMEYFTPRPDGSFEIVPRIREMVQFNRLNLADEAERRSPLTDGMDVIFCRNVMLYFHAAQVERTLSRFHAALRQGGWLFVGPTEVNHHRLRGFNCHYFDGAMVLRKSEPRQRQQRPAVPVLHHPPLHGPAAPAAPGAPALPSVAGKPEAPTNLRTAPVAPPPAAPPTDPVERALALYQAGEYEKAARVALTAPSRPDSLALAARCQANLGRYQEARDLCQGALSLDRLNARTHYLLSLVQEQLGYVDGALQSLKNAIYLDHDYLLAYFAQGNLYRKRGERHKAKRSFENALRLLRSLDPSEPLPEAEGMTAGTLARLIEGISGSIEPE